MQITKAHNEWATRPAEQRFWDLTELAQATRAMKQRAVQSTTALADLRVEADDGGLRIMGKQGVPARISHYAFGQLAARAKAPAGYLRGLPATLAAQNINHGFKALGNAEPDTQAQLLLHRGEELTLRAATSTSYSRVWNADLVDRLLQVLPQGWKAPPARPAPVSGAQRTRFATADDVSRMSQHLGLAVREGDTIAPAGLYASDKDLFVFLVNEDEAIDDGTGHPLFRGMMLWNSEVGDMSLGGMAFLLKGVCGNHIIHDASNVMEFNFRHVGSVQERTDRALEVEIRRYANSSGTEQHARLESAKRRVLGASKAEVVDAVLGFARTKRLQQLTPAVVGSAYDAAEEHASWYGNPRSVYGMVNGLTEVSQRNSHTDARQDLDRAAGRVLEMAF